MSPTARPGLRERLPDEHMNPETLPHDEEGLEFSLEGRERQDRGGGGSETQDSHIRSGGPET